MERTRKPWWETKIIDIKRNKLVIHGYRLDEIIGRVSYGEMFYLMIKGELPSPEIAGLMDALLVAGCDHGPLAPSVAAARMAATCGITLNSAIATGLNVLGDIHGGTIEQAMKLFYEAGEAMEQSEKTIEDVAEEIVRKHKEEHRYLPGYGHPLHTADPRPPRLFELAEQAKQSGVVSGRYINIAQAIERAIEKVYGRKLTCNIDGGSAAVACELGLPWQIGKGIFLLSRALGITAHAYEEQAAGTRLKGPIPPDQWQKEIVYTGTPERRLPKRFRER